MARLGAQPTLTGAVVRLRPWREDDVEWVFAACQDAEIQRWTVVPVPYRRQDAVFFVVENAARTWAAGGALFAVETVDTNELTGAMSLFAPHDGVGAGGYWTVAAHRGRGCTAEALRLLTDWALDSVGLRRMELVVDVTNVASRRVAERAGYRSEGVLRQRSLHRGVPVDDVIYGRLASDPPPTAA